MIPGTEYAEKEPRLATFCALYSLKVAASSARAEAGELSCITQEMPSWRIDPLSKDSATTILKLSWPSRVICVDTCAAVGSLSKSTHALAVLYGVIAEPPGRVLLRAMSSGLKPEKSPGRIRRALSGSGFGDATAVPDDDASGNKPANKKIAVGGRNTVERHSLPDARARSSIELRFLSSAKRRPRTWCTPFPFSRGSSAIVGSSVETVSDRSTSSRLVVGLFGGGEPDSRTFDVLFLGGRSGDGSDVDLHQPP